MKTLNAEIPDVIGFKGDFSFIIEAKTSRADFLADKKKPFRLNPSIGMGDFRFFIAPLNMIGISELPEGWGLIEVEGFKIVNVHNPFGKGNIYSNWIKNKKNNQAERYVMYSALRRIYNN